MTKTATKKPTNKTASKKEGKPVAKLLSREHIDLTIKDLIVDPSNVRKVKSDIKQLAANIDAIGLIENLVVRKTENSQYAIVAGQRRFLAIAYLNAENKWPDTKTIMCQICTDDEALDISLAENLHRQGLNPADEFEAFNALKKQGKNISQIAQTHGVTETVVKKRLKLATLSPRITQALREDKLDIHRAQAFALTDDHEQQEKIFDQMNTQRFGMSSQNIKDAITATEMSSSDKRVKFLTLKEYEFAGGALRKDLFGEDSYIQDIPLLTKLVDEKLLREKNKFLNDGWKWVEISHDSYFWELTSKMRKEASQSDELNEVEQKHYDQEQALYDEMYSSEDESDEMLAKIEAKEAYIESLEPKEYYTKDQKNFCGGFIGIERDGTLKIDMGWVHKDDEPMQKSTKGKEDSKPETDKTGISNKLKIELSYVNFTILKHELLANPKIAADLFMFEAVHKHKAERYAKDTCFDTSFKMSTSSGYMPETDILGPSKLIENYEALKGKFDFDWYDEENLIESFRRYRKLSMDDKLSHLALIAAYTLTPMTTDDYTSSPLNEAHTLMEIDVRKHWSPDEVYFKRMKTDALINIGGSLMGTDWTSEARDKKKSAIVKDLHDLFDSENKYGTKTAKQKADNWVPEELINTPKV